MVTLSNQVFYDTVYYSNFWYSRHYKSPLADFGGNLIRSEIELHKFQLRMLAIFFNRIYIPRTHLITQSISIQHLIPNQVLDSPEFKYLFERGVIRVSSSPGLDAAEDNERILSRVDDVNLVFYPSDTEYLKKIPISKAIEVDTIRESVGNTVTFPKYGEILHSRSPELAKQYFEAVKRAETTSLPFMHEQFIAQLSLDVDRSNFEKIWRETNSIYLTSGAPEHGGMVASFNEEIESKNFRFMPPHLDRYLFSPTSLYSFLQSYLDPSSIGRLLYDPIEVVFSEFHDVLSKSERQKFRKEYQSVVKKVSLVTRQPRYKNNFDQQFVSNLFELTLDDRFGEKAGLAEAILDDATTAARIADSEAAGIIGTVLKGGMRVGRNIARNVNRSRRYPMTSRAMKSLERSLKKAE